MKEPGNKLLEAAEIFNQDHDETKLIETIDSMIKAAEAENQEDAGNQGN